MQLLNTWTVRCLIGCRVWISLYFAHDSCFRDIAPLGEVAPIFFFFWVLKSLPKESQMWLVPEETLSCPPSLLHWCSHRRPSLTFKFISTLQSYFLQNCGNGLSRGKQNASCFISSYFLSVTYLNGTIRMYPGGMGVLFSKLKFTWLLRI